MDTKNYKSIVGISYVGKAVEAVVAILPDHHNVRVAQNSIYYFKDNEKITTDAAYEYYIKLRGIKFITSKVIKSDDVVTQETLEENKKLELNKPLVNGKTGAELVDEVHRELEGTDKVKLKSKLKSIKSNELTKDDYAGWLDMNYTDKSIRKFAKDNNISFEDDWAKEAIIDKILDTDLDLVIKTMNKK